MESARPRVRWAVVAAPTIAGIMAAIARLSPLRNADLLWQIRTGDEVLRTHGRLVTDWFSQAFRGRPIDDHEAALEVVLSLLNRAGGLVGVWWFNLALVVAFVMGATHVAGRSLRRDTTDGALAAFPPLLALAVVLPLCRARLELRAELVTLTAIAIAYALRRGDAELASWRRRLAPVLVAAAAAPFHALAWWIAVVPGVFFVERLLRRKQHPERLGKDLALEVASGALCVLAAELTAPGLIALNVSALRGSAIIEHITELRTPLALLVSGRSPVPVLALALSLCAAVGLLRLGGAGRARPSDALLVLALMVPGLRYARFSTAALIGALPWVLLGLGYFAEQLNRIARPVIRGALGALALGVSAYAMTPDLGLSAVSGFDFRPQPVAAVAWLRATRPDARLFHPYNFGPYLIFEGYPPGGVLIDPRAQTLYPDDYVRKYYEACASPGAFEQWASEASFDTVLLATDQGTQPLRTYLLQAPGWSLVSSDSVALVFVRRP